MGDEWLRVPVGLEAQRWTTRRDLRTALVVVHSVTALQRLLDVVPLFESDPAVQTVFTRAPGVFSAGVDDFLRALGACVAPWSQVVHTPFDLALAAGYTGLHELQAPVVVLPHGAGFTKFVPPARTGAVRTQPPVFGLSAQQLLRDGRVIPAAVVLSHVDDQTVLKEHCPEALPATVVAGDPGLDRLLLSSSRRDAHRRRSGFGPAQKVLVISSTWGGDSLFGARADVLEQAAEEAESAGYAVVVMLHPSVWFGHGPRQVRAWFRRYDGTGLVLLEPDVDWRSPLICADWFIGDHGSVSLYAAAVGIPMVRVPVPDHLVVPGSAMELLRATTPTVTTDEPILDQLAAATDRVPTAPDQDVVLRLTSHPGGSAEILRQVLYEHLGLDEPTSPAALDPVPLPARV